MFFLLKKYYQLTSRYAFKKRYLEVILEQKGLPWFSSKVLPVFLFFYVFAAMVVVGVSFEKTVFFGPFEYAKVPVLLGLFILCEIFSFAFELNFNPTKLTQNLNQFVIDRNELWLKNWLISFLGLRFYLFLSFIALTIIDHYLYIPDKSTVLLVKSLVLISFLHVNLSSIFCVISFNINGKTSSFSKHIIKLLLNVLIGVVVAATFFLDWAPSGLFTEGVFMIIVLGFLSVLISLIVVRKK